MIRLFYTHISENSKKYVNDTLESGFLNEGKYVDLFEENFKQKFNISNLVTTNSCTSALRMALELCNVKGKNVILPAQSFIATGTVVLECQANPVFVDIKNNGCIDPNSITDKILENAGAIIAVNWGGMPCDMHKLSKLNVPLIVDAAHGPGTIFRSSQLERYADFVCYSFQSIKPLPAANGGAISFSDPNLENEIRELKWFGMNKKNTIRSEDGHRLYDITRLGYKYDFTDYNAALALGNLEDFNERMKTRTNNAYSYKFELSNVSGITIPHSTLDIVSSSNWLFTMLVEDRKNFIRKLRDNGIEASTVDKRIDKHSIFVGENHLINQEIFDKKQVSIPVHENLSSENIDYITSKIKEGW